MSTLTAAEIKTILLTADFDEDEGIEINAALMQNEERRKYPSIDVQNITGEETIKDYPTKNITQVFLVHLFYRYRSFGEQHEPDIKVIEDKIFNILDAAGSFAVPGQKITVTQSWDRKSETFPVHRSHSVLRVTTEDIESTDGDGISGNEITVTFPDSLGPFDVINTITDEAGIIKDLDLTTASTEIYTKIRNNGLLSVTIAVSVSDEEDIKDLFFAGKDFTITVTRGTDVDARTANPISIIASGPRSEIQNQVVTMDILY